MNGDDPVRGEDVPTYTANEGDDVAAWADDLGTRAADLQLPVTQWPDLAPLIRRDPQPSGASSLSTEALQTHSRIIITFFSAIRSKNTELVTLLVSRGFISPDCPDGDGQTPLLAAVLAGNGTMVCTLMALGASVDTFGSLPKSGSPRRTPLQAAAGDGNLALVKLLLEDFHADDALLAPDGQLALRLAADNGHRDVVEFLPVRRGGAWTRWRTHHAVAWGRIKKAGRRIAFAGKCVFWYLPQALFWYCPKHCIVLPIYHGSKWCWEHRAGFGPWCKRQALAVGRGVKKLGRGLKKLPRAVRDAAVEISKWIWKCIKAIPHAVKIAAMWIWDSLKTVGKAVGDVAMKLISLVHTTIMAIMDFFRSITLKDVWNGICALVRAIFVDLPKAIWSLVRTFGEASYKFMASLFGLLGKAVWWIIRGMIELITYVPGQIWEMLVWTGSSMAKGWHEVMVWFDPKR